MTTRNPTQSTEGISALPIVKANGFTVISDAGAATGREGDLHVISLIGRKPAVEAVGAACLVGRGTVVYPSPLDPGFEAHAPLTWEFRQILRTLPSGDAHLLLLPARADMTRLQEGAFTLIAPLDTAETEGTMARLHYLFLSQSMPTPLAPAWDGWLWARAQAREEAQPLRCWGALVAAWSCHPDPEALRADLITALQGDTTYGSLPLLGASAARRVESVA